MSKYKDIKDDEIRIIGTTQEEKKKGGLWGWLAIALLAVACLVGAILYISRDEDPGDAQEENYEVVFEPTAPVTQDKEEVKLLGDYSDSTKAYTEHLKKTVNDIPLDIYIPHNAVPELFLGVPDLQDKSIVLTTQAADIRADNGKIVGAFVLKGEPLSWGLSKKGYCGIIDGNVTVGVAENSPLFEMATETGGYFFRQYPLVNNGVLVENEPKGKSIRKALCDRNGEIFVVMSQSQESFHDFAQALVDMGVDNAIYLVGSVSYGYFRDYYDHLAVIYDKRRRGYKNENFIVWRAISK